MSEVKSEGSVLLRVFAVLALAGLWIVAVFWFFAYQYGTSQPGTAPADSHLAPSTIGSDDAEDPRFATAAPSRNDLVRTCETTLESVVGLNDAVLADADAIAVGSTEERAECVLDSVDEAGDGRLKLAAEFRPHAYPDFERTIAPEERQDPCQSVTGGLTGLGVVEEFAGIDVCFEKVTPVDGVTWHLAAFTSHSTTVRVTAFVDDPDQGLSDLGERARDSMLGTVIEEFEAL